MTIKLRQVLALLKKFESNTLSISSTGDGYLCSESPLYRKIRQETLKNGFKFISDEPSPYFSCPLLGLNDMLKSKKINVWQNLYWLKRLEKERPDFYTLEDLYVLELNTNYLLHESAHAIAYKATFKTWKSFKDEKKDNNFSMKVMIGEAFANTCEVLVQKPHLTPTENYIYRNNFYFTLTNEQHELIKKSKEAFGNISTTTILLLTFLYANFLYKDLDEKDAQRIIKLSIPKDASKNSKDNRTLLLSLAKAIPLGLNISFRLQTTRIYLTSIGYSGNIFKDLKVDPGRFLEKNPEMMEIINKLSQNYTF
jgi:hypothetical protein